MLNFEMGDSVIYWKRHHQVVIPSIFFRNFSRKKCREYVQHALVFVREPDSDTHHSNTKPNENLNYVFFREKINQCRISLRLFNLERVFLHFQAEKNAPSCFTWIYKLWQKLCGKYKESFSTWRDELEMVICLTAVICLMFGMLFFSGYFLELTLDLCKICREIVKSVELVDKWILSVFVVFFLARYSRLSKKAYN